jgi:glycosyltransferase involved in cell wall biosynthesis
LLTGDTSIVNQHGKLNQTNNKIKVLYLSSWPIFSRNDRVLLPFVNEQIGLLSSEVSAVYVSLTFVNLWQWVKRFIGGSWIEKRKHRWLYREADVNSYHIYLPKISSRVTKNDLWKDYYYAARFLGKRIFKAIGEFEIIHLHTILPLGGFSLGLKQSLNLNYLIQEHSGPFNMHTDTKSKREGIIKITKEASLVLPVSGYLLDTMKDFCHEATRFDIGLNWVRTDIFKENNRKKSKADNCIISVASNNEVKNHSLMFQTIRRLTQLDESVSLDIYGTGYDSAFFEEHKVQDLVEKGIVNFRGHRDREELSVLMPNYDVYLCTSNVETFGLAPIEAICCGLVVVSTDCGGVREFINYNNGILAKADASSLAEAIMDRHSIKQSENNWDQINTNYGMTSFIRFYKKIYNEYKSKAY